MSTQEILDRLKAVCEAATDGPWESGATWDSKHEVTIQCVVTDTEDPNDSEDICESGDLGDPAQESMNMDLIALSRTALPALVEALERIDGWCEAERHAPPDKQEHSGWLMPIGVIRTIMISALAPLKDKP